MALYQTKTPITVEKLMHFIQQSMVFIRFTEKSSLINNELQHQMYVIDAEKLLKYLNDIPLEPATESKVKEH